MVPHRAGAELHAVAHQIVLVSGDAQGVDLALFGLQQHIQTAGGHGERIVAEFQLAGLVTDLVHGEVHDPAEGVLLLVHVTGNGSAQGLDQHTGGLEGSLPLTGGQSHEVVGLQAQSLHDLLLDGVDKLGNAAHQLAVFVHAEPVGLAARHSLHVR